MITLEKAQVKMFTEKEIKGQVAWIHIDRDDQDFDTLKAIGSGSDFGSYFGTMRRTYKNTTIFLE